MADSGATGYEMEDQGYSPVTLLEDSYTVYDNYASMHEFNDKSHPFYRLSEKIKGTYFIILNYYSTFHEFSSTAEALNLAFTSLDCIDLTRKNSKTDEEYLHKLLGTLEEIAMQVQTACFVTHSGKQDFTVGSKRRKTDTVQVRMEEEAGIPAVETRNRFQALAEAGSETVPSPSAVRPASSRKPEKVTQMSDMDTSDTVVPTATNRSVAKKSPRPPPITVMGHEAIFKTNKELKAIISGDLKVVNTKDGMRYYTNSEEDYKKVRNFFDQKKKQYFTHQIKSELPLRVVIKRLPNNADPNEIKEELIALGYPVKSVKQLSKVEEDRTVKFPVFPVELDNTEKAREIYNLTRLSYTVVAVDSYRPRAGLKQCFNCQRFNHTFAGCHLTARCLICAKNHSHRDCPVKAEAKNDKSKLKCANCNEDGHPASFRGCKSYIAALENFNKPKVNANKVAASKNTNGNTFNSKKVTQGLSYSSAVVNKPTEAPMASIQHRFEAAVNQARPQAGNPTNVEQMISNLGPMINCMDNNAAKFMLLSKLVEMCFGNNV